MLRKKKSRGKIRPFRRFDEVSMKSNISSSYEWFIFIIALAELCFLIYLLITAFI